MLGGAELYGKNSAWIPLRELIQNAADAVRARRLLEKRSDGWGHVRVTAGEDDEGRWLEVSDDGLGMTAAVLAGPLLDFGHSYWHSELMRQEHPGLESSGFVSSGRYGIGFFSVFMWGAHVLVTTRFRSGGIHDTLILECRSGVQSRPFLRNARADEGRIEPGTTVRVWFRNEAWTAFCNQAVNASLPRWWGSGRGSLAPLTSATFQWLCAYVAPALDVNLDVAFGPHSGANEASRTITAGDWRTLDPLKLLERVAGFSTHWHDADREAAPHMLPLLNHAAEVQGRMCIEAPYWFEREADWSPSSSEVCVVDKGGMRVGSLTGGGGLVMGQSQRAARDQSVVEFDPARLKEWLRNVGRSFLLANRWSMELIPYLAALAAAVATHVDDLPICLSGHGWQSAQQLRGSSVIPQRIVLVDFSLEDSSGAFRRDDYFYNRQSSVPAGVLYTMFRSDACRVPRWLIEAIQVASHDWKTIDQHPIVRREGLGLALLQALAAVWGALPDVVVSEVSWKSVGLSDHDRRRLHRQSSEPVLCPCFIISRPN